jgi:hypothetical protein
MTDGDVFEVTVCRQLFSQSFRRWVETTFR